MKIILKIIFDKIFYHLSKPYVKYRSSLMNTEFPEESSSSFRVWARLSLALKQIKRSDLLHNIGQLYPKANRYATKVYSTFLPYNPNNIGNWSVSPKESGTRLLEYELIHKLVNLYRADNENVEGYATSGGTEGNLYSIWIGKSYLLKSLQLNQICLLKTQLTHYSIDKSCHLCSIDQIDVPINYETWSMDPDSLEEIMHKKISNGKNGFIISLTVGYTETGTVDNISDINLVIKKIKKRYKDIYISIIVDAAFDGLVLPFVTSNFKPFSYKNVHAFCVDFSKFTAVPYPAGVVLYRKQLRKLVEKAVPVFSMKDNTISGSRPGAPVAAMWASIHKLGKKGFKELIKNKLQLKHFFIEEMTRLFPNSMIITSPYSLTCGVILNQNKNTCFSKEIENKYWLYAKKTSFIFSNKKKMNVVLYKFFFMPHVSKKSFEDFFTDVRRYALSGKQ